MQVYCRQILATIDLQYSFSLLTSHTMHNQLRFEQQDVAKQRSSTAYRIVPLGQGNSFNYLLSVHRCAGQRRGRGTLHEASPAEPIAQMTAVQGKIMIPYLLSKYSTPTATPAQLQ